MRFNNIILIYPRLRKLNLFYLKTFIRKKSLNNYLISRYLIINLNSIKNLFDLDILVQFKTKHKTLIIKINTKLLLILHPKSIQTNKLTR